MDFNTIKHHLYGISGSFILWIVIHYAAANLYPHFCAETTLFGFIKSIFVANTPHCVALRWVIYNGGNIINAMWSSIALWTTATLFNNIRCLNAQE